MQKLFNPDYSPHRRIDFLTQTLILDIVKVFCNYFELHENSNLGVEIIERFSDPAATDPAAT